MRSPESLRASLICYCLIRFPFRGPASALRRCESASSSALFNSTDSDKISFFLER